VAKRLFDILVAAGALIVAAPLLALAALGIRLSSPGPMLYRATRVGLQGRRFTMYKLRTMHLARAAGPVITGTDDPRVFAWGRLLRLTKVDELPQLWNVLRGDMAIVGPRPEDPAIVEQHYSAADRDTLDVRPGLASPGSLFHYTHGDELLAGGDPEARYIQRLLPVKLALERVYVRHASFAYDLRIIGRTAWVILGMAAGRRRFAAPPEMPEAKRRLSRAVLVGLFAGIVLMSVTTCRNDDTGVATAPDAPVAMADLASSTGSATLVAAGVIARCNQVGDDQTAALLDTLPGTVAALGDNEYDNASLQQYQTCYGPSWGRHKTRTSPAAGDKEYKTAGAAGYFSYFGAAAGDPSKGYYSYDLGAWHVIVLNSGTNQVPTSATSAQVAWLKSDLAAHPTQCTLAYWDRPLYDSKDKPYTQVRPLWDALYGGGVDVVLNAHYGFYERFAPQKPDASADPSFGIREFVVGTGGAAITSFGTAAKNSQVRNSGTFGVLTLTLNANDYSWQFVPVAGKTFTDSGTGTCHGLPPITVNAGADQATSPGTLMPLSISFTDPGTNGPWQYSVLWGDGTSSTASVTASPFVVSHSYADSGLDSVRVSITNPLGGSGSDSLAVHVQPFVVFVGAGDIADCSRNQDELTANLLDTIPGTVYVLGDNAYPHGSPTDYSNCYDPSWGRVKARTKPVPGNHEYETTNAAGYFGYFGAAAGDPSKGYYSYDYGGWHIIALNSEISYGTGSAQEVWLRNDLAAHPARCTLAYWHHPYFSSSTLLGTASEAPLVWDLYNAGAEIILAGHHHDYERFAPQSPDSVADPAHGIRQFVAGTGGESLFGFGSTAKNSEVRNDVTFGVLRFHLFPNGFDWKFIPIAGETFTDAGSGTCHDAPGVAPPPNNPPTAKAGGPYTGAEGSAVAFNGSGSSDPDGDPITYAWSFGDGATATVANPTHAYADNNTYTVTLTVTDSHGAASAPSSTTATITNVAPVVNAGPNRTATANIAFTLNATFSDPGTADAPWTYSVSWGDLTASTTGTVSNQASGISATHTYLVPGAFAVVVSVSDKDGATGVDTALVSVTAVNNPPTARAGGPYTGMAGTAVTFDGSGSSDPDGDTLTYAWSFGDGGSGAGVRPSHAYAAAGSYTVTLTVTDARGATSDPSSTTATIAAPSNVVLVGAGNIARCTASNDEATAAILDTVAGMVFTLGDNAFPGGTPTAYTNCYDPSWGRHKARTIPAIGNHDYDSSATATGYFGYFGAAAGDPTKGYYSFDTGTWHVIVLNSNNAFVSTAAGSPQETWLRADLAATTKQCVVALWHNPRFYSTTSSGFSPTSSIKPFWDDLYAAHAELVINGHMRDYERFAPQDPAGNADPANGIREIIAGTGGEGLDAPNTLIIPNSERNISQVFGVLKLTLSDGSYSWQFIPVAGQTATDSGSGTCH
jgi:lipopolysaccharide/colanic/teichoic acid biosynthesis glycosyltransferase/PKD repeat protein